MSNNNKAKPDPKTQSNATIVNDTVAPQIDPNHPSSGTGPAQAQPDPKTQSNATIVNETVAPQPDAQTKPQTKNSEWQPRGNPLSKKDNKLPPSSDQPEDLARKEKEQEAEAVEGRKKKNKKSNSKKDDDKKEVKKTTTVKKVEHHKKK